MIDDVAFLTQQQDVLNDDEEEYNNESSDDEREESPAKRMKYTTNAPEQESNNMISTFITQTIDIVSSDDEQEEDGDDLEITSVVSTQRTFSNSQLNTQQTQSISPPPPLPKANQTVPSSPQKSMNNVTECTICTCPLEKSGPHQVCCLNCGHLFGKKCIEKWLKRNKICPICQKKCFLDQLRLLYIENVVVIDDTEYGKLVSKYDELKDQYTNDIQQKNEEIEKLKREMSQLRSQNEQQVYRNQRTPPKFNSSMSSNTSPSHNNSIEAPSPPSLSPLSLSPLMRQSNNTTSSIDKFVQYRTVPINEGRVFDFDATGEHLMTSFKENNSYKIKQLNFSDISFAGEYSVHKDVIRDIRYSPYRNDIVLTVSTDKTAKVTDTRVKNSSIVYNLDHMGWSGCWKAERDSTVFYVGCYQSTDLLSFDTRKPGILLSKHQYAEPQFKNASITSLQYIPFSPYSQVSGVLAGSMCGVHFFSAANGFESYDLMSDVVCVSVCYDKDSKNCLATFRKPASNNLNLFNAEHSVFQLKNADLELDYKKNINNFKNKNISKSMLYRSSINKNVYLCSADESKSSCCIVWDISTGTKVQEIKVSQQKEIIYTCARYKDTIGIQTNASLSFYREQQ
jgi:E3 ubiquitin-protein ligase RFWD3